MFLKIVFHCQFPSSQMWISMQMEEGEEFTVGVENDNFVNFFSKTSIVWSCCNQAEWPTNMPPRLTVSASVPFNHCPNCFCHCIWIIGIHKVKLACILSW